MKALLIFPVGIIVVIAIMATLRGRPDDQHVAAIKAIESVLMDKDGNPLVRVIELVALIRGEARREAKIHGTDVSVEFAKIQNQLHDETGGIIPSYEDDPLPASE
jgi:hypothetical protein